MARQLKEPADTSTEEKIKQAASKIFTIKGYAATRTRDIAEEAGLNLALLNYYFRSKEKLFELIMAEKMQQFFGVIEPVLNNEESTLEDKIALIAENYIDLLSKNPELPLFVLSEIKTSPAHFLKIMGKATGLIKSNFIGQIQERKPGMHPLQFLFNIMSLCIFPFIMNPVLQSMGALNNKQFGLMMKERKLLIPAWIKSMLETG